jgi:uncharacterized protein involved in exopolysaccharide biosynthesis/Mrp family chromosome partitioning ATPase
MDLPAGTVALNPPQESGGGLGLSHIGRLLMHHVWLIGLCGLVAAVGSFLFAHSLPKTYVASSAITVEGERFVIPELQGALRGENAPDPMPWVRTEVQALTSRAQIQGVITRLGLDRDPEFNESLRPESFLHSIKMAVMALLPQGDGSTADTAAGINETVLLNVTKALGIFQDNRSLVISTSFTAHDPVLAANVVNTLIAGYIQGRANRRVDANRGANDVMVQRINQAKADLDGIEQKMLDLRNKNQLVGLRAGSVGQQQLEELATAAARASVERAQLEATWDRASTLAGQGLSDALVSVLGSPTISRLREQESTAMRRVAELSSRYGADYPGVRAANADLRAARAQIGGEVQRIVSSLGAQLRVAREQEADVKRQLAAARQAGVMTENAQAQLTELQQEAATRRNLYQTLLSRGQQTVAQPTGTETPDVRILSEAVPPGSPSGPNVKLITGAGGLSGLLLGALFALTRIRGMDVFETAPDLVRATGLPVLASLPRGALATGRKSMVAQVMNLPNGVDADAMRQLRGKLRFVGSRKVPRSVLFTSALAGRGHEAASVAAAFARVAAVDGERVLLVEGNLIAPAIGRVLNTNVEGLMHVLEGGMDWRDAVEPDIDSPLDLLLAGGRIDNSHGLLSGMAFQNLLVEARLDYDLVVMDGPPPSSADTTALVMRADATMLLVDAKTSQTTIRDAVARLGRGNATPLNIVMISGSVSVPV